MFRLCFAIVASLCITHKTIHFNRTMLGSGVHKKFAFYSSPLDKMSVM